MDGELRARLFWSPEAERLVGEAGSRLLGLVV